MIELIVSATALIWCAWAWYQCRKNRRAIGKESERIERLKHALVTHQMAPNPHGARSWDMQTPL